MVSGEHFMQNLCPQTGQRSEAKLQEPYPVRLSHNGRSGWTARFRRAGRGHVLREPRKTSTSRDE